MGVEGEERGKFHQKLNVQNFVIKGAWSEFLMSIRKVCGRRIFNHFEVGLFFVFGGKRAKICLNKLWMKNLKQTTKFLIINQCSKLHKMFKQTKCRIIYWLCCIYIPLNSSKCLFKLIISMICWLSFFVISFVLLP